MSSRITMFGKTYAAVGEDSAHLVLRTAGDVQVKTKDRFITIFKNGKLNVNDSSEIFSVNSLDEVKKTGVYLVSSVSESGEEQQDVYLCIDGTKILLASSSEGFVSYSAIQELKPENFLQAAKNIGLYFETAEEAKASGLTSGLVYILSEQKLYKIVNGELVDINAANEAESGSQENQDQDTEEEEIDSLKIGYIFLDGTAGIISGESQLVIQVDGNEYLKFNSGNIYPKQDIVLDPNKKVYYPDGVQGQAGFWIYAVNGESYLETDYLIVHNNSDGYTPKLYSTYIGSKVKSLISKASWVTAPTDIQLDLKYPAEFAVGDLVVVQTAGGNLAKLDYREDSDESTTERIVSVTLETVPSQTTVLKIGYTYAIDDEGNIADGEVTISIDPTAQPIGDGGEDDEDEGNTYGEATVPNAVDSFTSLEIVSGDKDIYFIDEDGIQHGGSSLPIAMTGTVTNTSPLTINVPSQAETGNSVLRNLEYSVIYKIASAGNPETVLWHEDASITLFECSADGSRKPTTRLGDLSDIPNPANEAESLEGYGVYSENAVFKKPKEYGTVFEGNEESWYPRYGDLLELPADPEDTVYDKVVPTVGWMKKLVETIAKKAIDKFVADELPAIVEQAVKDAIDAQTSS